MYLFMDFETYSPVDIKCGVRKYSTHPDADIICGVFKLVKQDRQKIETSLIDPAKRIYDEFTFSILENISQYFYDERIKFIIAHNIEFDLEMYIQVLQKKYGFPEIPPHIKFICTKKRQDFFCQPASLENSAKFHKLTEQKNERGKFLIQQLSIPDKKTGKRRFDTSLEAEMLQYCIQDVNTTIELFFAQMEFSKQFRIKNNDYAIQCLDTEINRTGMPVNPNLAFKLNLVGQEQIAEAQLEACKLFEDFNMPALTQAAALKAYIKNKTGYEIESFDDNKQTHKNAPDLVLQLLDLREQCTQNSLSKAESVLENSVDGRLYNQFKYYGAHTGRWSGRDFQPQNLPRTSNQEDPKSFLRNVVATGSDSSLIVMDYAAIEHRALFYLAIKLGEKLGINCEETKKHFAGFLTNEDAYVGFAAKIYNIDKSTLTKKSPERTVGKVGHLSLGYGTGSEKFQWIAKQQANLDFKEEESKNIVNTYRSTYSLIPKFWYYILNEIIAVVRLNEDCEVDLFHGIKLIYKPKIDKSPSTNCLALVLPSERPIFYYDLNLKIKEFYGKEKECLLLGKFDTHGGLLVENIIQAFCRDIMAYHMLQLNKELKNAKIVMHVHDEICVETLDSDLDFNYDLVKKLKNNSDKFFEGLPLELEISIGKFYSK